MSISNITNNLTPKNFKIIDNNVFITNNNKPGILLIHATWCGHCTKFIPIFKALNQKLNKNGVKFPCFAIEDASLKQDGGNLARALNINGFPTIKFFDQHGKIIGDYNGSRNQNDLLTTICRVYKHCVTEH